jgi:uncharacterized membrane protein YobD (UPF0266 family)
LFLNIFLSFLNNANVIFANSSPYPSIYFFIYSLIIEMAFSSNSFIILATNAAGFAAMAYNSLAAP